MPALLPIAVLGACASKDDTPETTSAGLTAGSSEGGEESGEDESSGPEPMPTTSSTSASTTTSDPDPFCGDDACDPDEDCGTCPQDCNACPASCGDGQCDPDESCGSCAADCGDCCGDGICGDGEDWESCWLDCSADAPMLEFEGLYTGCSGQTLLSDGDPESDYLWVRADTRALMYVENDVVHEVAGSEVIWESDYWDVVHIDGATIGYVVCGDAAADGCAASIATYSRCAVPQAPGAGSSEVVDFTVDGGGVSAVEGAGFFACDLLCGNGTCDPHETSFACGDLSHLCDADCE